MSKELWEIVPVGIAVRGESLPGTIGFIRKKGLVLKRWISALSLSVLPHGLRSEATPVSIYKLGVRWLGFETQAPSYLNPKAFAL